MRSGDRHVPNARTSGISTTPPASFSSAAQPPAPGAFWSGGRIADVIVSGILMIAGILGFAALALTSLFLVMMSDGGSCPPAGRSAPLCLPRRVRHREREPRALTCVGIPGVATSAIVPPAMWGPRLTVAARERTHPQWRDAGMDGTRWTQGAARTSCFERWPSFDRMVRSRRPD